MNKKLKEKALKSLKGNYKPLVGALLVFIFINLCCHFIGCLVNNSLIEYPLAFILGSLFIMGYVKMVVGISKNKKVKFSDLTSETDSFLKYIGITLIISAITYALSMLAGFTFLSLSNVIIHFSSINTLLAILTILFGLILMLFIIVMIIYIDIMFSQSLFVLNDKKDVSVIEALSISFDYMDGYVLDYLILSLSFIGWMILGMFTFGILYLWLIPYMCVTMANFYEMVKKDYQKYIKSQNKLFNDEDVELVHKEK